MLMGFRRRADDEGSRRSRLLTLVLRLAVNAAALCRGVDVGGFWRPPDD